MTRRRDADVHYDACHSTECPCYQDGAAELATARAIVTDLAYTDPRHFTAIETLCARAIQAIGGRASIGPVPTTTEKL